MGYYIETGKAKGKAMDIVAMCHDSELLDDPPKFYDTIPEGKGLIVVVDNGAFEAAAFCYSAAEFEVFVNDTLNRLRHYVLVPRDWAEKNSGFTR
jgi:hypothetical protein